MRELEARLTLRVLAIAATVSCLDAYRSGATGTLWTVSTDRRPPWRPRARAAASPVMVSTRWRSDRPSRRSR